MKTRFLGVAAALALFGVVSPASAVNLLTNGGFEAGTYVDGGSGYETLTAIDNSITGWTVTNGSIDWIGSYWTPAEGVHSIDLSGVGLGTIASASFAATAGVTYLVTFELAGNPDSGPTIKTLNVSSNGSPVNPFSFDTTGRTHSSMGWTLASFTFVGAPIGGLETITFTSTSCCSVNLDFPFAFGPALDDVSVTAAVPELSTWAMMLIGFAGIGFAAYRRTKKGAVAIAAA